MDPLIFDCGPSGDDLPPFPRWMEPHFRRLDRIGTVIGIILSVVIWGGLAYLIFT